MLIESFANEPIFNNRLYDISNELFLDEYDSYCNEFEKEEECINTGKTSCDSHDSEEEDEEKFIPSNLFDTSPDNQCANKEQYIEIIKINSEDSKEKSLYINGEKNSETEEKNSIQMNKNEKNSKEILMEKQEKEYISSLPSNFVYQLDFNSEPFIPKFKNSQSQLSNDQSNISDKDNKKSKNHINLFKDDYNNNQKEEKNYNENKKNKKKKKVFIKRKNDWYCYRCKNINFGFRVKCNKCQLKKEESEEKYNEAYEKLLKIANVLDNN